MDKMNTKPKKRRDKREKRRETEEIRQKDGFPLFLFVLHCLYFRLLYHNTYIYKQDYYLL